MGSEDVRRDARRSHTVVVDGDEWMLPEVPQEFDSEVEHSNALAVRQPNQNAETPRRGKVSDGFFG